MDAFVSRKKRKLEEQAEEPFEGAPIVSVILATPTEDDTDMKVAILASIYPAVDYATLLEALITCDGSIEAAKSALKVFSEPERRLASPKSSALAYQSSLSAYGLSGSPQPRPGQTPLTKKGQTLHLYDPKDVAAHTPCSIVHNFLPPADADALLSELLEEARTFQRQTFRIFDNVVQSPHSACFYVESNEERSRQKTEYLYNGSNLTDVRELMPQMRAVQDRVRKAVNREIATRIRTHYPEGKKLRHQSPDEWLPNAAFVNCYAGGAESVGYHSDQLTYLGPRSVIGSISLGVTREFRVRKIVARDTESDSGKASRADQEGQIAIHLPHNSLLVMHAEMQEGWKHSIAPAQTISPHPISGNRRINITYRCYKEHFHPKYTPKCRCGIATVLKCVQQRQANRGRYMWMCHAGNSVDTEKGCSFFQWADFDDDGNPPWAPDFKRASSTRS